MSLAPVSSILSGPGALIGAAGPSGVSPARPSPADVQKAVRQFEAILVRQLLAPSIDPLMNGSTLGSTPGAGSGGGVYGYLLTDSLAGSIAAGGGLGLASVLSRQFSSAGDDLAGSDPEQP